MNEKMKQSIENLTNALSRLDEAIQTPNPDNNTLMIDGTIQRFEFCIELFWKTLKRALLENGVETGTPKDTIKKAYQVNWIQDEKVWIKMLLDRNSTSHTYEEDNAFDVYERIPLYHSEMVKMLEVIRNEVQ